jgi:carbamoyltransferase
MKSQNVILGINWEQNSSAAPMINGKIVGCTSEERFSRVKNDERYPLQSINYLIKNFSIKSQDINTVCFISEQWAPGYILTRRYTTMSIEDYIHEQKKGMVSKNL